MDDHKYPAGFKEVCLPNLETLLHHSLTLTQNGRDAVALMSEAMAVARTLWDASELEGHHTAWLHHMVTRQFRDGFDRCGREPSTMSDSHYDNTALGTDRHPVPASAVPGRSSLLTSEWENDVHYFEAIAELPEVFRGTLIVSYLDGIANREQADLARTEPSPVEPLLSESRRFIREELYSHLMDPDGLSGVQD